MTTNHLSEQASKQQRVLLIAVVGALLVLGLFVFLANEDVEMSTKMGVLLCGTAIATPPTWIAFCRSEDGKGDREYSRKKLQNQKMKSVIPDEKETIAYAEALLMPPEKLDRDWVTVGISSFLVCAIGVVLLAI